MEVKGRDLVQNPKTLRVSSTEVRDALNEPVSIIIEAVKQALEQTPPELSGRHSGQRDHHDRRQRAAAGTR